MKILTIDIGTGTQDIFLYDSRMDMENGYKLIIPSPTMLVFWKIQEITRRRETVLLTGSTMGGGPSQWAVESHLREGLLVYATPEAARSFNDDLQVVQEMGIQVVSEEEAQGLSNRFQRIELGDFNFELISRCFETAGISLSNLSGLGLAVFDHGNAPAGYSDRQFRFEYLEARIRADNRLSAFAYRVEDIPTIMTRMKAVADSARDIDAPIVVMDTAPAAILGATYDPYVAAYEHLLVVNIGNFHSLAFRLGPGGIEGMFEHHTGMLVDNKLESLLQALANGTLTYKEVFGDHGHGALILNSSPILLAEKDHTQGCSHCRVVVTGPRRKLLQSSLLNPYFAVPFGDMMICGCIGLLAAMAELNSEMADQIHASMTTKVDLGKAPWNINVPWEVNG